MLRCIGPERLRRIREVFAAAGYGPKNLFDMFGGAALPSRIERSLPHFLRKTGGGRPLDIIIRLFLLGQRVDTETARQALRPVALEDWVEAGLLGVDGEGMYSPVQVMPLRELLLVIDPPELNDGAIRRDRVMGLTASTMSLANLIVPRHCRQALDLGTGAGVLALLVASQAEEIVATDVSARALAFAKFNAGLNGAANVHFLEGDLFEPVGNRKFDLVLSNPPFAVSPFCRYVYRDSGLDTDRFAQKLIRQGAEHLHEGGYCQICCDWVHVAGEDPAERLRRWFVGSGCDAWVLREATQDSGDYAHMWIRDTEQQPPEACARLYDEWLAYFARRRIEAISSGLITLRRRGARKNWVVIDDLPEGTAGPVGESVLTGFLLRDYLEAANVEERLLNERLRSSPHLRLHRQFAPAEGMWRPISAQLCLTRGLPFSGNVDANAATLLASCDGRRPLRELLVNLAASLNVAVDSITPACLALVHNLVGRGFLLPECVQETGGRASDARPMG